MKIWLTSEATASKRMVFPLFFSGFIGIFNEFGDEYTG